MSLLEELTIGTYRQYTDGKKILQRRNQALSSYLSDIPAIPVLSLIDLQFFLFKVESMRKQVSLRDPGACSQAALWDSVTVAHMLDKHVWTSDAKDLVRVACRTIFGAEPEHMSWLFFLTYGAAAGGIDPLISTKVNIGAQELRVQGTAAGICTKLAEGIGSANIRLSCPVHKISESLDAVQVHCVDGQVLTTKKVIISIPPHQIARLTFEPALDSGRFHVLQRMPVSYMTKIVVTYSSAFWRRAGCSGEAVTLGGRSVLDACDSGPLCAVFDGTSPRDEPALVTFIGGRQHHLYAHLPAGERRRAVLHSLAELFGPEAGSPLDYAEHDWCAEPWGGGGPVCVGLPGAAAGLAHALRQPHGSCHFAGTESATAWCGYMNGAVQSGRRAATEVLHCLYPGMLEATDLKGTCYDTSPPPTDRTGGGVRRWIVSAAAVCLLAALARKVACRGGLKFR